jgi:hypothetical protein
MFRQGHETVDWDRAPKRLPPQQWLEDDDDPFEPDEETVSAARLPPLGSVVWTNETSAGPIPAIVPGAEVNRTSNPGKRATTRRQSVRVSFSARAN